MNGICIFSQEIEEIFAFSFFLLSSHSILLNFFQDVTEMFEKTLVDFLTSSFDFGLILYGLLLGS